jgi:hypothetical protein
LAVRVLLFHLRRLIRLYFLQYSKSYPNVSPMLSFTSAKNVSPAQLNTLTKLVLARARELLGSEVVFDIAGLVEDWLTAECQPPPAPASQVKLDAKAESLLVEMAKREKEAKAVSCLPINVRHPSPL